MSKDLQTLSPAELVAEVSRLRALVESQKQKLRVNRKKGDSSARQSLYLAVVGPIMALIGTIIGALMAHTFTTDQERAKALTERKGEAYVALLTAEVAGRLSREESNGTALGRKQVDQTVGEALEQKFQIEGDSAIRRIAIFGDREVVHAIAEWKRAGDHKGLCQSDWEKDLDMWVEMRKNVLGSDANQRVTDSDLWQLALPCNPTAEQASRREARKPSQSASAGT
jgi:hypothetical protein